MQNLNRRSFYNKKTDKEEVRFYTGRRKATKAELKAAMRADMDQFNPDYLRPEDRQLLGRIRGGLSRAEKAVRIDGHFVSPLFLKERRFDEQATIKGYATTKSLFEHEPEVYENAKRQYYSKDGIKVGEVSTVDLIKRIDTFKGDVFINEIQTPKMSAIFRVQNFFSWAVREMNAYLVLYDIIYRQGSHLHFNIPDHESIEIIDEAHIEELVNRWENIGVTAKIGSRVEGGSGSNSTTPEPDKPDRYSYKVTELKKGKSGRNYKKNTVIDAYSLTDAMQKITEEKDRVIISVNRIFENQNGGKKNK